MMNRIISQIKKPFYSTVIFAFVSGLFIHLFGLINVLHNHDSIYRIPNGYGTGVRSGRWFLTILGDLVNNIFGGYNLAWVNGGIFIALVAISAGFITRIFEIKTRNSAMLIGICMVSFPSVASTLFYRFTSVYYGISIFLSIFAVYAVKNYKLGYPIAILCIALSMGIYQAYASFTIVLFIILLIKLSLDNKTTIKQLILTGFYYVSILILGVLLYFLLMKFSLIIYNTSLGDYKGINTMGIFSIHQIPKLIVEAFMPVVNLSFKDYKDISQTDLIRNIYLLVGLIVVVDLIILFVAKTKKFLNTIFCLILCLLFPIAANFVVFMCSIEDVYTLMLYPLVTILFLPIVLQENIPLLDGKFKIVIKYLKKTTVIALIVLTFCYSYQTNTNYTIQYYNNQQIKNYYNRMITQVQMTEGYDTEKEWVFIGKIKDPLLPKSWNKTNPYGGNLTLKTLINSRRTSWMSQYLGISIPTANESDKAALLKTETVKNMPCWPNNGAIQIIDDFIVIKLSEENK